MCTCVYNPLTPNKTQDWDGHEQPLHVGLDPEIRKGFVDQLDLWRDQCKTWVTTGKYCLTMPNASSIRNAMALARRSEYTQEARYSGYLAHVYAKV